MNPSSPAGEDHIHLLGLELDTRATIFIVVSTLLLTIDHYHRFIPAEGYAGLLTAKALERVLYYLLIPLMIILAFRDKPSQYGFQIGDWRQGLSWTAGIILLGAPILFFAARTEDMIRYYSAVERPIAHVLSVSALDLIGWEFVFRGFLLFGLARIAGPNAVLLQAVPFAMAHLGKPELETLSTIFGGALFGVVAWRTRSFIYPFLIHWFITTFVTLVAMGIIGGGI
jgi:membrane protease YdiL (CAAX protease family)